MNCKNCGAPDEGGVKCGYCKTILREPPRWPQGGCYTMTAASFNPAYEFTDVYGRRIRVS